ncbi:pectate lyase [Natranaerovirga pectinivora]|uniref:Pectate lyase n=1 Tax=Natranaerovirga pectinivora TaxID=682400 RepID=A0A4R3MM79_9FIRM|nr:RICIN domain-containing protein [Natranaerovirga pectinivora]TCT15355.1 pectate lyase [Natranaerovirga pectinivora]
MRKGISFISVLSLFFTLLLGFNYTTTLGSTMIYSDDFLGVTSGNLFTTSYKSLPNDPSKPMYLKTGGTVIAGSSTVTLDGGRMTIGALSTSSTSSSSTPGGVFDLSGNYRIVLNVSSKGGTSSKKFQVYVDNNTTSQSNSIHGGASKVYEETIGNLSTGNIIIDSNIGTQNSFIQIRTESGGSVTINEVRIETQGGSSPPPSQPGFSPNDEFRIISRFSGKALDVINASQENGAEIVQWDFNGSSNQVWHLIPDGQGYYSIANKNSGRVIDVYNWSTANGGQIVQWDSWGGDCQLWSVNDLGNGYYSIINKFSGKSLDVYNFSQQNGGIIAQWEYLNGHNQHWAIEKISGGSNPPSNPTPPPSGSMFDLVGYAALNGGTTGGAGGDVIYVDNGADLYQALRQKRNNNTPLTIYITGTITQANSSHSKIDVKDVSDVSIIGVGTSGELDGVGITISRANNIIIRNLSIHHVRQGSGTAIEITESSHNIWIDHNDFYSQTDVHKDYYDGLVDIKRNAEYITVSWNKFYDHHKGMLVGHTDNESLKADKITYHHNYFYNIGTRLPLIRYADVHMFNNYFKDIFGSAINARMGARVRVENNYFDNVGSGQVDTHAGYIQGPIGWFYGSSQTGYWHVIGNKFVNCPVSNYTSTTTFNVPYNYSSVLHTADEAKDLVLQYAGVGIIN